MLTCMKGVEIIFGKRAQPCTQSRLLAKASMLRRRIPACHPKQAKSGNYHSYLGGTETGPSEQTAISAELKQSQASEQVVVVVLRFVRFALTLENTWVAGVGGKRPLCATGGNGGSLLLSHGDRKPIPSTNHPKEL